MTALLEQMIEARICDALTAATPGLPVVGFWQPFAEGEVKERPRSCVEVTVKPRGADGWGSDIRSFSVAVSVEAGTEDDPIGASVVAAYAAVVGVLEEWQGEDNEATAGALSVDGFDAQGFNFSEGGDCGLDQQSAVWFATLQCEIKGCKVEPETEEN